MNPHFFIYNVERKCGIKSSDVGWRAKSIKSGYIYFHPNGDHKYFYMNSRGYLDEEKMFYLILLMKINKSFY